jgi:metal-responsive CopG/Arc/MetJ family transcriptional regulator
VSIARIAASLPQEQFRELEAVRHQLHLKRSEAIQQALALWLASRGRDAKVGQYLAGYQARPDDDLDGTAAAEAWATGLVGEEW